MRRVIPINKSHDEVFDVELSAIIPYHRMYNKEYCVPSFMPYSSLEVNELAEASQAIDAIYWKALRFAQRYLPDTFLEQVLAIHPALIPLARMETPLHGIARLDWIINEHGMKCIENNCDTPSGIPEVSFVANELIERYVMNDSVDSRDEAVPAHRDKSQILSINEQKSHSGNREEWRLLSSTSASMKEDIAEAMIGLIKHYEELGVEGILAFSSYDWHVEDHANTEYIRQCLLQRGYDSVYVPLQRLELIPGDGLYVDGQRIGILYRLYPLEYLVHDVDETGTRSIGLDLLELVRQGKLHLINPGQSIMMQSKGFMALIWSLYERRAESMQFCGFELWTEEDIVLIERYMLPTYFEDSVFLQENLPYVAKGMWGREGKGTSIHTEVTEACESSHDALAIGQESDEEQQYYTSQQKIYQQYWPLEQVDIMTEDGVFSGYLLTGSFVIGGKFAGLLPRVGERITGDMAYYCPAIVYEAI